MKVGRIGSTPVVGVTSRGVLHRGGSGMTYTGGSIKDLLTVYLRLQSTTYLCLGRPHRSTPGAGIRCGEQGRRGRESWRVTVGSWATRGLARHDTTTADTSFVLLSCPGLRDFSWLLSRDHPVPTRVHPLPGASRGMSGGSRHPGTLRRGFLPRCTTGTLDTYSGINLFPKMSPLSNS